MMFMFKTEPMKKIRIISITQNREKLIQNLHKQGILEIKKSEISIEDDSVSQFENQISDSLIKVSGALQILEDKIKDLKIIPQKNQDKIKHINLKNLLNSVIELKSIDNVYELKQQQNSINEDLAKLEKAENTANMFKEININFSNLNNSILKFNAFLCDYKTSLLFEQHLKKIKNQGIITKKVSKDLFLLFIFYHKNNELQVNEILKTIKIKEIDLKQIYLDGTPKQILKTVSLKKHLNQIQLLKFDNDFKKIILDQYLRYTSIKEMLQIELQRSTISSNFKKTQKTIIIEGWVPSKKFNEFNISLNKITNNEIVIEEIKTTELAPTLLNRPGILGSFDYIMEFLSVPRSDEIDPTWIFIFSFLIFYGIMVSDVGYGVLSLLFAIGITKITDREGLVYNVAKIWQISALSAIVFGFLSNQYFGFSLNNYFINYQAFSWIKDMQFLILLTVFFGVAQVIIGLMFSFINNYNKHNISLAISKITSILTIIFGILAIAGGLFYLLNSFQTMIWSILAIISLIITGVLSGIEATELTNLITHPLSYARLFGFGLASIIIAMLIDQAFTPTLSLGIPMFIIFSIIFILLHFLNMIMTIFEGLVQGVRLNYVEFFSKFYTGGGSKFKPFSYKRNYTKD